MSKHVAVLMGGWSAEREVSLRSGKACADALVRQGYRVTRIDVGRDIGAVLTTVKPDVALNVLHGRPGEDGTLQGLLEIMAIPYSHSGVMASAVACPWSPRATATTAAPEAPSASAIALPMPRDAPVTMATRPLKSSCIEDGVGGGVEPAPCPSVDSGAGA